MKIADLNKLCKDTKVNSFTNRLVYIYSIKMLLHLRRIKYKSKAPEMIQIHHTCLLSWTIECCMLVCSYHGLSELFFHASWRTALETFLHKVSFTKAAKK